MTTLLYTVVAVALSAAAILQLLRSDPKRARVLKRDIKTAGWLRSKLIFVTLLLSPGIGLIALGNIAALFSWFAGTTVIGWRLTLTGNRRLSNRIPSSEL